MVERVEGLVGLAPGVRSGGDLLPGEAGAEAGGEGALATGA